MPETIERIFDAEQPIAFVIRAAHLPAATEFVTPDTFTQQVGFIVHRRGHTIQPHIHLPLRRELLNTSEVLFVRTGRARLDLYTGERRLLKSLVLEKGDVAVLVSGGHGFEMLEDSVLVEVKQGPYVGVVEKERFTP